MIFDDRMRAAYAANGPNVLISWWLMAAYAYDVQDDTILEDTTWDWMCKEIEDNWDKIEHIHKHLIDGPKCRSAISRAVPWHDMPQRFYRALQMLRWEAGLSVRTNDWDPSHIRNLRAANKKKVQAN